MLVTEKYALPFAGMLNEKLIAATIPSTADSAVESLKDRAALLSLSIFDMGQKDLLLNNGQRFSAFFSQEKFGAGFTKGLSILWAYLICLDEQASSLQSPQVTEFAEKIQKIGQEVLNRLKSNDKQLSDVRRQAEQIDNFGGYYDRKELNPETIKNIFSKGRFDVGVEIDACSGHLVAKLPQDFSLQLLESYRSEVESYLTEEGKSQFTLPFNTGFVVIAYKDELSKMSLSEKEALLNQQVDLNFNKPYIVPVRGDNRYALVASITIDSKKITELRESINLKPLYSEGRPLRFTFGAVYNPHLPLDEKTLLEGIQKNPSLKEWVKLTESC